MKFDCPHCKQSLDAEPDMEGQPITCPNCAHNILIPLSAKAVTHAALVVRPVTRALLPADPQTGATAPHTAPQRVIITDVQMSIWSLMVLFFKCAIAWIPVALLIGFVFMFLFLLTMGGCAAALTAFIEQAMKGSHP